jgi:excisionase family DNA binding protein
MSGPGAADRRAAAAVDRVVVVHGAADPATNAALASAGLVVRLEVGDTRVWAPAGWTGVVGPVAAAEERAEPTARLLLTVAEAASALGVGRTTAYELISAGRLEVVHVGRCARVPADAVKELVDRLRQETAARSRTAGTVAMPGTAGASQRTAAFPDRRAGQAS